MPVHPSIRLMLADLLSSSGRIPSPDVKHIIRQVRSQALNSIRPVRPLDTSLLKCMVHVSYIYMTCVGHKQTQKHAMAEFGQITHEIQCTFACL